MIAAGLSLMGVSLVVMMTAIGLEVKWQEPVWAIIMKVSCLTTTSGAIMFAVASYC